MTADRVRVGEVLRLVRRPVVVDPLRDYEEIGVRSFGKGIFHKEPVSGATLGSKRVFEIHPRELVLSNVFAWEGAVAVSTDADGGKIGSHRFMTYEAIDERIDIHWAGWFFRSEPGVELLGKASPGSAGRNRTLAVERFEDLKIPLPSVEVQRRISEQLDRSAAAVERLRCLRDRASTLVRALPLAVAEDGLRSGPLHHMRLGDVLEQIRIPCEIDPTSIYTTMGIRSFGKGIFHYPPAAGHQIGKLRFFEVPVGALALSNIKAWEGAIALTGLEEESVLASNRFLFYRARAGACDVRYLRWALLGEAGLAAIGRASPGSADRNRTLGISRFEDVVLQLPGAREQHQLGDALERLESKSDAVKVRGVHAQTLLQAVGPAASNRVFRSLSSS
jgi:type I restriction enzyme S subunit